MTGSRFSLLLSDRLGGLSHSRPPDSHIATLRRRPASLQKSRLPGWRQSAYCRWADDTAEGSPRGVPPGRRRPGRRSRFDVLTGSLPTGKVSWTPGLRRVRVCCIAAASSAPAELLVSAPAPAGRRRQIQPGGLRRYEPRQQWKIKAWRIPIRPAAPPAEAVSYHTLTASAFSGVSLKLLAASGRAG